MVMDAGDRSSCKRRTQPMHEERAGRAKLTSKASLYIFLVNFIINYVIICRVVVCFARGSQVGSDRGRVGTCRERRLIASHCE